jgi:hypothetical protein
VVDCLAQQPKSLLWQATGNVLLTKATEIVAFGSAAAGCF